MVRLFLLLFLLHTVVWSQDRPLKEMPHGTDFNRECEDCHSSQDWTVKPQAMTFNHDETGFFLLGGHSAASCKSCHQSLIFNQIGTACADCHSDIHKGELGFRCESCHTPQSWENKAEMFEQHAQTSFPLTGIHALLDCQACHQSEQQRTFANTSTQCKSCHLNDYMQTLNPAHQRAGFSLNCESCHTANAVNWKGALWEHSALFPLRGAHARLICADCHQNELSTPLSTECYSCHAADYNQTQSPDHAAANFSTECQTCHTETSWIPAEFDHNNTTFPLTGAHVSANCQDCHSDGYSNIPSDCISCHEQEYNETVNPSHQAAGFPVTCADCHTTSRWEPADFDHDGLYFPIYSGEHKGEWNTCSDCHINPSDYSGFECITCHEHRQTKMDDEHKDVRDYSYDSASCYSCHPDGKKEDD